MRAQALVIVLGIPVGLLVLGLIQPEQLDELPGLCLWKRVTGRPCFGCGTTHALSALMHGDLSAAARYNRIVYILVPVGMWIWLAQLRILWTGKPTSAPPPDTTSPKAKG